MPGTQTLTTLSAEAKTYYDRVLLNRAEPTLVWSNFGQNRPLPRNGGKSIEFRRFEALAAASTPLTEGTTPAGNDLSITAVTATIAQYGDFIVGSDLVELAAIDPVLTETAQVLGDQAGLTLDRACRDIIGAGTTVQYAAGRASRVTVASTDVMTVSEVRKARRTLKRNKVKPFADGCFVAIVEPGVAYDIQTDTAWVNAHVYSDSVTLYNGELGRLYGVRFVETTESLKFTGAGAGGIDVYGTMVFGQNAYGTVPLDGAALEFIFKPVGSSGTADPLNQRWSSGWKAIQTFKILNDLFMVRIESAITA